MTTPKDTWISVKDAMPPIEPVEGYDLIGINKYYAVASINYYEGRICYDNDKSFIELQFWMLLSKPKNK